MKSQMFTVLYNTYTMKTYHKTLAYMSEPIYENTNEKEFKKQTKER